jgi:DNA-nicking Smr family endonuclease
MATVKPLDPRKAIASPAPFPPVPAATKPATTPRRAVPLPAPLPAPARPVPGTTLDGGWDRRLSRGMVQPDTTVDLHGHTLNSAYAMLDDALGRSIARGDRVVLLITGKPPRPDSERPHARGAIRAAVGDWLHASRHADAIAAVRGASPRHGGSGALYIVLRRPRGARNS